jgi:hypothetical protein
MVRLLDILRGLAALRGTAEAAFSGAGFTLNYPDQLNGAIDITHVKTTLVVPHAPHPETNVLALWPGVQSEPGPDEVVGLVQSIAASFGHPQDPKPNGCNGTAGQWCAFTYEYVSNGGSKPGPTIAVNAGAHLSKKRYTPVEENAPADRLYSWNIQSRAPIIIRPSR